jgi:hypothetical protein
MIGICDGTSDLEHLVFYVFDVDPEKRLVDFILSNLISELFFIVT